MKHNKILKTYRSKIDNVQNWNDFIDVIQNLDSEPIVENNTPIQFLTFEILKTQTHRLSFHALQLLLIAYKKDDTLFLVCEYPGINSNRRIAWGLIGSDSFTFQNR